MISTFAGQRAVVTGAASGIGKALVGQLLDAGARVMAMDVNPVALSALEAGFARAADRLHTLAVDVSDDAQVRAGKARCDDLMGGVDLLFNNAGVAWNARPIWETPQDQVEWNFAVNVHGVISGLRAYVPDMIARGSGHVINTASIGGFQVSERLDIWHQGLYAATKYAVVALSEALEIELRGSGVGVSILAPGGVATAIASSDSVKPGRFGGPTEGSATAAMREMLARDGASPDFVAEVALRGVLANQLYIFTHPEFAARIAARDAAVRAGFAASEQLVSDALRSQSRARRDRGE